MKTVYFVWFERVSTPSSVSHSGPFSADFWSDREQAQRRVEELTATEQERVDQGFQGSPSRYFYVEAGRLHE
jgi:hypothetical protein